MKLNMKQENLKSVTPYDLASKNGKGLIDRLFSLY